jgi:hypothetical protein
MADSCATCKYQHQDEQGQLWCRRWPPRQFPMPHPNGRGMTWFSDFAPITPDKWCGEFQEALVVKAGVGDMRKLTLS